MKKLIKKILNEEIKSNRVTRKIDAFFDALGPTTGSKKYRFGEVDLEEYQNVDEKTFNKFPCGEWVDTKFITYTINYGNDQQVMIDYFVCSTHENHTTNETVIMFRYNTDYDEGVEKYMELMPQEYMLARLDAAIGVGKEELNEQRKPNRAYRKLDGLVAELNEKSEAKLNGNINYMVGDYDTDWDVPEDEWLERGCDNPDEEDCGNDCWVYKFKQYHIGIQFEEDWADGFFDIYVCSDDSSMLSKDVIFYTNELHTGDIEYEILKNIEKYLNLMTFEDGLKWLDENIYKISN